MIALRKDIILSIKILLFLMAGLVLTTSMLAALYESNGIAFRGNVWVNWFGVSYLLYFIVTMVNGLFNHDNNVAFKSRISSVVFWLLFIGSIYVVFIPFLKGENPF